MDKKSALTFNRRKFLTITGAATGFTLVPEWVGAANNTDENCTTEKLYITLPESLIATIIETKIICQEPGKYLGDGSTYDVDTHMHPVITKRIVEAGRYLGWATITKTDKGELIVAFSGDRDAHVCPWGKTQIIRSIDKGKTWSAPETITNTPLDDRDTGIIQTDKGTLLVSWFTSVAFTLPNNRQAVERYARVAEKITPETRKQWLGHWIKRSVDNGKTWQAPIPTVASGPHGPIQLRDGRLLYIGTGKWENKSTVVIEQSADDGLSWNVIASIPKTKDILETTLLSEPHMVELESGKLIAMVRNEPKDRSQCFLLQSESYDGGKTWSLLRNTGIWGYPPHLMQLTNGWVLVAYGYRREPYGEKACISRDEGRTWDLDNEIMIAGALGYDLGYPSSVQLDDNSIITVYYQPEKPGGSTNIKSTHWELK